MSTANIAATRLQLLLKDKGEGFLSMAGSVKAYFHQQLSEFPEEKKVLEAAYDRGLHKQLTVPEGANKDEFYKAVADKFAKQAGIHPEWAEWAVQAWATALDDPRKRRIVHPALPVLRAKPKDAEEQINKRYDDDPQLKILRGGSPIWLRFLMTLMIAFGGFMGGFIGRNAPIGAIMLGFEAVDSTIGKEQFEEFVPKDQRLTAGQKVIGYSLFFLFFGGPVAFVSMAASAAGWLFGRADGRPWMGMSAVFSAAFGVNVIFSLLGCGIILAPLISAGVCFAAAFKTAATTT